MADGQTLTQTIQRLVELIGREVELLSPELQRRLEIQILRTRLETLQSFDEVLITIISKIIRRMQLRI